jgi:hypothetical protein
MHKLVTSALSSIPLVLSVAVMDGQLPQDQLIGRWRSTEVSASGVSAVFEFHDDNQLDSYSAAISDGNYRLIGTDTIVMQTKGAREEKLELEWDNQDRARIEDEAAGKFTNLARLGKILDSKNPLVGEWSTTRDWNGKNYPARAWFLPDGKVVWITTLRAEHGRYSVQNKNIRLELPGRPVVEGNITITADRLTLPNPKGGESAFERF